MRNTFDCVKIPQDLQAHVPAQIQSLYFNHLIPLDTLDWIESPHGTLEEKLKRQTIKYQNYLTDFPELKLQEQVCKQLKNDWLWAAFLNPGLSAEQLFEMAAILEFPLHLLIENTFILGHVDFFNFLLTQFPEKMNDVYLSLFNLSAFYGHDKLVNTLLSAKPEHIDLTKCLTIVINSASSSHQTHVITTLFQNLAEPMVHALIHPLQSDLLVHLINHNDTELVLSLIETVPAALLLDFVLANDYQLLKTALQKNNQVLIQKLKDISNPLLGPQKITYLTQFIEIGCRFNHPSLVESLWQECSNSQQMTLLYCSQFTFLVTACRHGSTDVLKSLLEKHQSYFSHQQLQIILKQLLTHAGNAGKLNTLKYLHSLIEESNQKCCLVALLTPDLFRSEHINLLNWIFLNSSPEMIQKELSKDQMKLAIKIWHSRDSELIHLLFSNPDIFAYFDAHIDHDRQLIEKFANNFSKMILRLSIFHPQEADLRLKDPIVLKTIFYVILHHINQGNEQSLRCIEQLLEIPEVKEIAHLGEEPQQLLKAAQKNFNLEAIHLLSFTAPIEASDSVPENGRYSP